MATTATAWNLASQWNRAAKRILRPIVLPFRRIRLNEPLPPSGRRAFLQPLKPVVIVERAEPFGCVVEVQNHGTHPWSPWGTHPVTLRARWLSWKYEPVPDTPTPSLTLPTVALPGEAVTVELPLTAPEALGDYQLELELGQPNAPFREGGTGPSWVEVKVTGRHRESIDYFKSYTAVDLSKNWWLVVGPTSKEEFDRLGKVKLQHLIDLGLTPNSRVLDVGCGTGQLTAALESYLSDAGCYLGTDVGKEGIEFCRRHYRRSNFQFAVNGMTSLPIHDRQFDVITYFSVFTHTYPDETALLLAESKRLLAPNGFIFADVFTSPLVERYSGNRGAVEVNYEHLMRLIQLVGLRAELIMEGAWQKFSKRQFFRLTHAC